ncbi:MAG: hypothetical protein ACYDBH_09525 [Acidobacteriaceae bacterium]
MTKIRSQRFPAILALGFFFLCWLPAKAASTPGFTITAPASTITIKNPGGNRVNFTITPQNGFTGTVNVGCTLTENPQGTMYPPFCGQTGPAMAPPTVTGPSPVTFSLTIATYGEPMPVSLRYRRPAFPAGGYALLACALLIFIPASGRTRRDLLCLVFASVLIAPIGCGSGIANNRTPAGNYVFTVMGTDQATGKIQASTNVTVIVQ